MTIWRVLCVALVGVGTMAFGNTSQVHARCVEPYIGLVPPDAPSSRHRPDVPYCLSTYSWSREHTCDSWEIESYKSEVEDYIDKLNEFVEEAEDLSRRAQLFAQEAYDYAKCEAEEVSSQHE